jgi:hypothetical protein
MLGGHTPVRKAVTGSEGFGRQPPFAPVDPQRKAYRHETGDPLDSNITDGTFSSTITSNFENGEVHVDPVNHDVPRSEVENSGGHRPHRQVRYA